MTSYDHVHPEHRGPNTVQMTRLQVADLIRAAGHRYVLDIPSGTGALTQLLVDRGVEVVSAETSIRSTSSRRVEHVCLRTLMPGSRLMMPSSMPVCVSRELSILSPLTTLRVRPIGFFVWAGKCTLRRRIFYPFDLGSATS